ncbi:hypothetical protein COT78_02810 [Candidatus Berkelbacteria bacterium CG10_big_fil_rev_8_21_14_0_10_43_13]|uniref:PEGA domain-containing protein n=1 Tax=Candidatus Berkelbacteria bacterium CG10_big_fil_rev_8_21_14_0_10_43_13 TaxID=1974514 RepID=A0A2H0W6H2_9BACT|nr:MAG: hypothetical protein COT78_02810 [Candidatus Berkelbacteria bacterium CG10_big_fil_rev_8_21_14_0_10_43_13]
MVRNDRRTRLLPKILFGQSIVAFIVILMSLGVIFYAEGYRFDFSTFRVVKTGVLYLKFQPRNVTISVNDLRQEESSSFVENLTPGLYHVSVDKSGYVSWKLGLQVRSQSVNEFSDIILFRSKIPVSDLTDPDKIGILTEPTEVLASNAPDQLLYNEYEIWVGNQLVTRFASPVQGAVWYPDLAHIVYQQGKEIRLIESNGQNDTALVKLSSDTPTIFAIGSRGSELYFQDDGKYKMAKIR